MDQIMVKVNPEDNHIKEIIEKIINDGEVPYIIKNTMEKYSNANCGTKHYIMCKQYQHFMKIFCKKSG